MFSHLLTAFTKKKDDFVTLNIKSSVDSPPRPYVPSERVLIGKETGAHVSIQVTERSGADTLAAQVTVSVHIKNARRVAFRAGELRRFAADIDNVRRRETGVAQLTIIPDSLGFNILFDENRQLIFALRYRRIPALAVDTISTFSLDPAELETIIDRLKAADQ
jgi:hypothetical protein